MTNALSLFLTVRRVREDAARIDGDKTFLVVDDHPTPDSFSRIHVLIIPDDCCTRYFEDFSTRKPSHNSLGQSESIMDISSRHLPDLSDVTGTAGQDFSDASLHSA